MDNYVDNIVISKHVLLFTNRYIPAEGDNCSSIFALFKVRLANLGGHKVSQQFKDMLAALKKYGNANIIEVTQRYVFYEGVYKVLFSQFSDKCRNIDKDNKDDENDENEYVPLLTLTDINDFDKAFVTKVTFFSKDAEFALKAVMGEFKNDNNVFENTVYNAALAKFKEYRDRIMKEVDDYKRAADAIAANRKSTPPPSQLSTMNATKKNATSKKKRCLRK